MPVVNEKETPTVSATKPKPKRQRASAVRSRGKAKPRKTTPPNRVDPGWIHVTAAELALRLLQSKAPVPLDVGQVNSDEGPLGEIAPMNERAPVETLSRIFAHLGHRLPIVDKIEKRLEGQDKKSGMGSDLAALAVDLFKRNEPMFKNLVVQVVQQQQAERAAKEAAKRGTDPGASTHEQGVTA